MSSLVTEVGRIALNCMLIAPIWIVIFPLDHKRSGYIDDDVCCVQTLQHVTLIKSTLGNVRDHGRKLAHWMPLDGEQFSTSCDR